MKRRKNYDYDVIVVGAGVGGAALALALAHAHPVRVLLVERRSGPGNINRGDSILPAISRHLATWGVLDRFYAAGAAPIAKMQVHHLTRGLLMEAPLADPAGHPYIVLPHPEIERALTAGGRATGRVEVRYLTKLVGVVEESGRVTGVELSESGGPATRVTARLVVGADGSTSVVRARLGIPLAIKSYPAGYYMLDFDRPAAYEDAMRLHLHANGGVMVMPQPDGAVGTAVLVHARDFDFFRAGALEDKAAEIGRRVPILAGCTPRPRHAHLYALGRGHAPTYLARGAALIGDAVHVTNPTAGQGMTMAVEDAHALARRVAPLLADGAADNELDEALAAYQAERRPINAGLIRWSHLFGLFFAARGPLVREVRARIFGFGASRVGQWIQRRVWRRVATRSPATEARGPLAPPARIAGASS